jgi:hypothetical protein
MNTHQIPKSIKSPLSVLTHLSALLLPLAACANTVVMDFDHLLTPNTLNYFSSPYLEDGLRLVNSNTISSWFIHLGFDNGHKSFMNQTVGDPNTLTAEGGVPFKLVSIRLYPVVGAFNTQVTFTGNLLGGGTVTQTFSTGSSTAGQLAVFPSNFQGLTSVNWEQSANGHLFDDITVTLPAKLSVPASITMTEAAESVAVRVTLSEPVATTVNLPYTIADLTTTQPSDYTRPGGQANGTVSIPPGLTETVLTIPVINDNTVEPLETFRVTFGPPPTSSSFFGNPSITTISIGNDDGIADFPAWMSNHGLIANAATPTADPNGDGISNIEAWLFRLNPAGPSPQTWLERRPAFLLSNGFPALSYTIIAPFPTDVDISFAETTDLSSWSEQARRLGFSGSTPWTGVGASRVLETSTPSSRVVTMSASQAANARQKAFLRLKYTHIPGGRN